jgi:hypothetical protein
VSPTRQRRYRPDNIYSADERVGATLKRAHGNAQSWIQDQRAEGTKQR